MPVRITGNPEVNGIRVSGDIVGIERTQQGRRGRSERSARGFNVVGQPCLIEAVQGQGQVGDAGEARDLRGIQTASRNERAANRAPALAVDNGLRINQRWAGGKQRYSQHLAPGMGVMHQCIAVNSPNWLNVP
jgi:hypothetical protein